MKYYKRLFSVLLVVVTLFVTFSITANAEQLELDYYIHHSAEFYDKVSGYREETSLEFHTDNGRQDIGNIEPKGVLYGTDYEFIIGYEFIANSPPLIPKGNDTVITMFEGYYGVGLKNVSTGSFSYARSVSNARLLITYSDNTKEYIDDVDYTLKDNKITLKCSLVPEKDIKSIKFLVSQNKTISTPHELYYYLGEQFGTDKGFDLSVNQEKEEVGLLKSAVDWLKGIKNGIGDLFNSIKELPSKLWDLISNGLKSLFVPDSDYIGGYKDSWDELLSSRFGALYQVGSIISEFGSRILFLLSSDPVYEIYFPEVSLEAVGIPFTFGGYNVSIVPEGFEFIMEFIYVFVLFCAVVLFCNALRKRYDDIMGGRS